MPHPWSKLSSNLMVNAFVEARKLEIPPEVMVGAALRCAAEIVVLSGVREADFIDSCRHAFALSAEAQKQTSKRLEG